MSKDKEHSESKQTLEALKEWLTTQPHLPRDIDDFLLNRFLHSCYYVLEDTKRCIDKFYTIRSSAPEIFNNRDPLSKELQKTFSYTKSACIQTKTNDNVMFWCLNDPGMSNYGQTETTKVFMMMADVRLLEDADLPARDIFIMDCRDFNLKFITRLCIGVTKTSSRYLQEAMPVRLKQIHVLNAPPFADKLYSVVKPFLSSAYYDMIFFHRPNTETIFNYLERDHLPEEYGGTAGRMDDLNAEWHARILKKRDFFLNESFWKADLSQRNNENSPWFFTRFFGK